jgi:outer membrane biosynthesis protein TonB
MPPDLEHFQHDTLAEYAYAQHMPSPVWHLDLHADARMTLSLFEADVLMPQPAPKKPAPKKKPTKKKSTKPKPTKKKATKPKPHAKPHAKPHPKPTKKTTPKPKPTVHKPTPKVRIALATATSAPAL